MIEHFEKEYPREACGLLYGNKFYPCKNVAQDDNDFQFDAKEYLMYVRALGQPDFIVHTHPDSSSAPSPADTASCNSLGIPFLIYSFPDISDYTIVQPSKTLLPPLGREYRFGTNDCFSAVHDFYTDKGLPLKPRLPFEDDWWLKGKDYFSEEIFNYYGFKPVDKLQEDDLLVFNYGSEVGNHCGVYLGRDMFYHHAVNRLSCRENLYPFWIKHLYGIYRYAT